MNLSKYRKALAALATFLVILLSNGFLTGKAEGIAATVVSGLGTFGVYAARNDDYPVEK